MADLEYKVKLIGEGSSAEAELQKVRQQIKGVSDETAAYNKWLEKNAQQLGAESQAVATATAELERYQQALKRMHDEQERAGSVATPDTFTPSGIKEKLAARAAAADKLSAAAAEQVKQESSLTGATKYQIEAMRLEGLNSEENARKTSFLTNRKETLKKAIHGVGQVFPEVGLAARLFLSPFTALVYTGVYAITKMREGIKELNSSLDDLASSGNNRPDFMGKIKDAYRAAKVAAIEYNHEIEKTVRGHTDTSHATDLAIANINREADAATKLRQARKTLNEARIDQLHQQGVLSDKQVIELKLKLDDAEFLAQLKADEDKARRILDTKRNEAKTIDAELQTKLSPAVASAAGKYSKTQSARIIAEEKLAADKKNQAEDEAAVAKAKARADELDAMRNSWTFDPAISVHRAERKHLFELAEAKTEELNKRARAIERQEAALAKIIADDEMAKADLDEAKQQKHDAFKRQGDLRGQINEGTSELDFTKKTNRQTAAVVLEANRTTATTKEMDVDQKSAADNLKRIQSGKKDAPSTVPILNSDADYHDAVKQGFGKLSEAQKKQAKDLIKYVDSRIAEVSNP